MARQDPHSYADDTQPRASHLEWRASVDFATRTLQAEATLTFDTPAVEAGPLDLDTRDLAIDAVTSLGLDPAPLPFELGEPDPVLGTRLRVTLPAGVTGVRMQYRTNPVATALQWLESAQTAGGQQPFLYSQCQAIHARSVVPLQDTPTTRLRYRAELTVPRALRGLMGAAFVDRREQGEHAIERYEMLQPISPYLFALAVGDLASSDVGPRCRVWAEPRLLEQAAWEFADTERMLETGETLFGPYDWERYDVLVLPPSFPYGGMENPRLTFLTPTVIAGDRSLVSVIAHELAHSWTGNLVSNANGNHFWLNEGFTTYAERRIVEALYGPDVAALDWALGRRELDEAVVLLERLGHPEWTALRTSLDSVDPDEAYSVVPYEKGALLLRALEETVGREAFDAFLHRYIERFRFQALTTEDFVRFAEAELPSGTLERVGAHVWLHEPGVPDSAPRPRSTRLEAVERVGAAVPEPQQAGTWSAVEWQLFIEGLPRSAPVDLLAEIDQRFGLTGGGNYDVLEKWLALGIRSGYPAALPRVEQVLSTAGRMKYLKPLYRALAERRDTRSLAESLFEKNAASYHPIAQAAIRQVLEHAVVKAA